MGEGAALPFPSKTLAIDQLLVKWKRRGKKKNTRERDKFRTVLQEAGRDQLKLFQVARRARFGSKLKLLARARTKALSTRGLAPCLPLSCLV